MSSIPDAEPARPWRPQDGPRPTVWTWPRTDRPALRVMSGGQWRHASVIARQDWADGTVRYQVEVDLRGDTATRIALYQWPQPGLAVARRSAHEPTQRVDETWQGDMPHRGPVEAGPRRSGESG
ncbi:hypothetical protein AQJ30_15500 [Streptomyces longwoodensis]|uniref:Uncharacterized protein n=1 Tax=Streptomyces longwoodensis TaxID=68231 RepID=A0A101QX90_9ACTN|nr:hypothetical protein [Streptomyces longwoodensis]KUN37688.1 hypothetical protein AQJ30_15500 [Streptomyces longwoodensis]